MNRQKVKWGVLGVAGIAVKKVIPAMQKGSWGEIAAIASRDPRKAHDAATKLDIAKACGSYEELLADPEIEAIYNPLPNHLHVPWTIQAAEAGKHVLCEKPISLTVREAKSLLRARDRCGVKIGEAFMVKTHPQWLRVRDLISKGVVGKLRSTIAAFSYFNRDPQNVRNVAEWGGGGLLDIGCVTEVTKRIIEFDEERQARLIQAQGTFSASARDGRPGAFAGFLDTGDLVAPPRTGGRALDAEGCQPAAVLVQRRADERGDVAGQKARSLGVTETHVRTDVIDDDRLTAHARLDHCRSIRG